MRWLLLFAGLALLAAGPAWAQESAPCTEMVGRDFSVAAPEEVGLSSARLLELSDALDAASYDIRGLLILRNCRLAFERYKSSVARDFNHTLYSATKSVTSTLVGALIHQGRLPSVDVSVAAVVTRPPRMTDETWAKAERLTLKNVMQMASGLDYLHDPVRNPIYSLRIDRFAHALAPDFVAPPGTKFLYSDGDVSITGAVAADAAGHRLLVAAKAALFEPMNMVNYDWWYADYAGRDPGGWGLRMRPMDMAKIGQLYLQGCVWNGQRICDASYIAQAWAPGPNPSYGLHWWLSRVADRQVFSARGFKGQRIVMIPDLQIVVAIVAALTAAETRAVDELLASSVIAASSSSVSAADAGTLERLAGIQKAGFKGQTRVMVEDQDTPRR